MAMQQSKLIMDSICWAFKHHERGIAENGLAILLQFLHNISDDVANGFYSCYTLSLVSDLFAVLTDRLHKPGFKLHVAILRKIINTISSGVIVVPLSPEQQTAQPTPVDNVSFLKGRLCQMLASFPNLSQPQIELFVRGLFEKQYDEQAFKVHLRDFLVALREFAGQDVTDLFEEEAEAEERRKREAARARNEAIPGISGPHGDIGTQAPRIADDMNMT